MHAYERFILLSYLTNLSAMPKEDWRLMWRRSELPDWFFCHFNDLGIRAPKLPSDEAAVHAGNGHGKLVTLDELLETAPEKAGDAIRACLQALPPATSPSRFSASERRIKWIGAHTGMKEGDMAVLGLLARATTAPLVKQLLGALKGVLRYAPCAASQPEEVDITHIAGALRLPIHSVRKTLSAQAPLLAFGLVVDRRGDDYAISNTVLHLLSEQRLTNSRARELLLGKPRRSSLGWTDFSHLGPDADLAADLIRAGGKAREQGINILLYGPPGAGKTEFASVLASHLGLDALFVGEADEDGDEPERHNRIAALAVGQRVAAQAGKVLLIVDEADDLFVGVGASSSMKRRGSKIFMNRLVDGSPLPTIWITNHPDQLGKAVLRRMTFAMELCEPDRSQRRRMVQRMANRRGASLSAEDLEMLADIKAPAAVIDSGIRTAALCQGGGATAARVASSIEVVMQGRGSAVNRREPEFIADICRTDRPLEDLVTRSAANQQLPVSFCFFGAPGTGKSAFARYLASRMGYDVLEYRASDLLGKYVGETEQNIAAAFRKATHQKAFLVFDEADSLLGDRASARTQWEVSQVNEMLTCMETHTLPFACTTNRHDALDPASMRRFLFKVQFMPMSWPELQAAFRKYFHAECPSGLRRVDCLTPGDFALVSRRMALMGTSDPEVVAAELMNEASMKPGEQQRPMGFRAGAPFISQ